VASRLSEEYGCPAFLICMDKDKGKASSRSYGGFNLFAALSDLSDLLESYGGHELAAGFTITRENIPAFRRKITEMAAAYSSSGNAETALQVDCRVDPELLTLDNVRDLSQLEPCGSGCPTPVFCLQNVTVSQLSEVGGGKHLRMSLSWEDGKSLPAIFFSQTAQRTAVSLGDVVDVAFTPQINEFKGQRSVQLNLVDVRPCDRVRAEAADERALYGKLCEDSAVSADEAKRLLPARAEFVAVWRYLMANHHEGLLQEDFLCMSRKIARSAGLEISAARIRVCLDVFAERGLVELQSCQKQLRVHIVSDGRKVDLDASPIVQTLRAAKKQ
jgi:single-stranded-DNA-specific exonuclease